MWTVDQSECIFQPLEQFVLELANILNKSKQRLDISQYKVSYL